MRATKGDRIKFILIAVLLLMGVGYAYLTTNLNINGTANVKRATWDVHFENINVKEGSVTTVTQAPTINSDFISINYSITLNEPGDFYEFTVDIKNGGTIDAMIGTITSTINGVSPGELPAYLLYSVTYYDGVEIEENQRLGAGEKETYRVRIEYNADVSPDSLPQTDSIYNVDFSAPYIQRGDGAKNVNHIKVGDYFSLTPDSNSYTILPSESGYSSNQTINPSELQLWRVISINDDMSIDAVSEYVSSDDVTFLGTIGYAKCINTLNEIAQQYNNSEYTKGARMFGFDNQTLVIDNTYYFNGSTTTSPGRFDTGKPTEGVGEEYENGLLGDTLYLKDYVLVSSVYKADNNNTYGSTGLIAYDAVRNWQSHYYVSSRYYYDGNYQSYNFTIRYINSVTGALDGRSPRYYSRNEIEWKNQTVSFGVRPIITLKPYVIPDDGEGTKDSPYTLTKASN